jgi:signal transduction histidine kinase
MNVKRPRLTWKLLFLLLGPTVVCMTTYGLVSASQRRSEFLAEADRELVDHVAALKTTLPPVARQGDLSVMAHIAETVGQRQRVHGIAIYDPKCHVIARSQDLERDAAKVDGVACATLVEGRERHGVEEIGGVETLLRAEAMEPGSPLGVVVVTHNLEDVEAMIRGGSLRLAVAGGLLVLAIGLVALGIARILGHGLGQLVQAAEQVAAGERGVRVEERPGRLGLERVAAYFNLMTRALDEAHERVVEAERHRFELERRVRHAQSLSVVGQVAASLAHDVGSPLSVILSWAHMTALDESLPEATRAEAHMIAEQCERITRIVRRMTATALPEGEEREPLDLGLVLQEVAGFLAPECRRRGIAIRLELGESLPSIEAVRDQLLQMVMNLGVNAVQAQPQGGHLVMTLTPGAGFGDTAELVLEVRDAGPGVPPELRSQIFEPFYSTRRTTGGTGLGLSIVAGIARSHGGTIAVDTAPEGGACFRVRLPCSLSLRERQPRNDAAAA